MNHHTIPTIRRRWIAASLALVVLAAAWLTRAVWLPLLPAWAKQVLAVSQVWGNFIQTLTDLLAIIVLIGGGLAAWLGLRRRSLNAAEHGIRVMSPLRQVTPQILLEKTLAGGGSIQWVDRGATVIGDLMRHPCLIIVGPSRLGKTREALELIRRAIHHDHVTRQRIFEPDYLDIHFLTGDGLAEAIRQTVSPDLPALLFVDRFTYLYTTAEARKQLATVLDTLRACKPLFVIMTGRDDELTADQQSWLAQRGFHVLPLASLTDAQMQGFVQNVADQLNIDVTEGAAQSLIRLARGNPEVARQTLLKATDVSVRVVDEAFVGLHGRSTVRELWAQTRLDIDARWPTAGYVLDALGVFDAARVPPQRDMVLAYAAHLWRQKRGLLIWPRRRVLVRILADLASHEIRVVDQTIQYPDQAVSEAPATEVSRQALSRFLQGYRRWLQHQWLRRLNGLRIPHMLALFGLAWTYEGEGQYRPAVDAYTAAIRVTPFFGSYINRGNARVAYGDTAGALADYDIAIALAPQYDKNYNCRGNARAAEGDMAGALADYDQAIALNPQNALPYTNRGTVRKAQGDVAGALADYDQAIALFADGPDKATAYNNRGTARQTQGDLAGALADYDQAITLNPQDAVAYNNRGTVRQAQGDVAGALADYDQVITLDPQDFAAYNNRGLVRGEQGDVAGALSLLAAAYNNRGLARKAQGDVAGALADYDQAIALDPQDFAAYNNRGLVRAEQGDVAGALADYDQAIALDPQDAKAYYNRGNTRAEQGDVPGALADYDQAIALDPQDAAAYRNRGLARAEQRDVAGALADYDRAIALNPQDAKVYYIRGLARSEQGDVAGALADYDRAIALDPQDSAAYNNRGLARAEQGDVAGALADYDQAIVLDPQYAAAYRIRGFARAEQGDVAGALADYDQAIALDPQDARAYYNRGNTRAEQGDVAGALADYDQAIALFPDGPNKARSMRQKGLVLRQSEEWLPAKMIYEQATALDPGSGYGWMGLADAARELGDEGTYRGALARATALFADEDVYDRACLASIADDVEQAFSLLAEALAADPGQRAWARKDPELRCLHGDERFWELVGTRAD